jgi:hypothetical protein
MSRFVKFGSPMIFLLGCAALMIAYNLPLHAEVPAKDILVWGFFGLIYGTIVLAVFIPLAWLANQARASKAEAMRIRASDPGSDSDALAQRLETRSKRLGWTGAALLALALLGPLFLM